MNPTFRPADLDCAADRRTIVQMLNEFMGGQSHEDMPPIGEGVVDGMKNLGTARVYFCQADGEPCGLAVCFLGYSTYQQKVLLNIHDYYIRREHRGQGLGRRFLQYLEEECRRSGYGRMTLEVYDDNPKARQLYSRSGFIGDANGEHNHLIYAMKKDLA